MSIPHATTEIDLVPLEAQQEKKAAPHFCGSPMPASGRCQWQTFLKRWKPWRSHRPEMSFGAVLPRPFCFKMVPHRYLFSYSLTIRHFRLIWLMNLSASITRCAEPSNALRMPRQTPLKVFQRNTSKASFQKLPKLNSQHYHRRIGWVCLGNGGASWTHTSAILKRLTHQIRCLQIFGGMKRALGWPLWIELSWSCLPSARPSRNSREKVLIRPDVDSAAPKAGTILAPPLSACKTIEQQISYIYISGHDVDH